jgi:hypothetical protein
MGQRSASCHVLQAVLFICKVKPVCELNVGDRLQGWRYVRLYLLETREHTKSTVQETLSNPE